MQKRILVLTSNKSGKGGHRSSSNAIKSALLELAPNVDVKDVDSMEFMPGYTGDENDEQGYVTLTSRYRFFWKFFFEFSSFFAGFSNFILYQTIFKRFRKLVLDYKPDVILSVHPCFVGSVSRCLKRMKLDIPFCTCIIDLVKHSRLWHDKECAITFVPTAAMYNLLLKKGFKKERLVHSGFPIKEKFNRMHKSPRTEILVPNVLMVNPTLKGNKATLALILAALKHQVNLTVITGSNQKLKKYLDEKILGVKNVTVLDYVFDMDARLSNADVIITKAGPNMILEAVKMCVPVLITGHILGQEEKNYQYIVENGYGLKCDSPKELSGALARLFENDYELLKKFSYNEQGCNDTAGANVIAEHLLILLI